MFNIKYTLLYLRCQIIISHTATPLRIILITYHTDNIPGPYIYYIGKWVYTYTQLGIYTYFYIK